MKLSEWLDLTGNGAAQRLADVVGVSPSTISRLANVAQRPAPDLAAAISAATLGAVRVSDLLFPDGLPAGARP